MSFTPLFCLSFMKVSFFLLVYVLIFFFFKISLMSSVIGFLFRKLCCFNGPVNDSYESINLPWIFSCPMTSFCYNLAFMLFWLFFMASSRSDSYDLLIRRSVIMLFEFIFFILFLQVKWSLFWTWMNQLWMVINCYIHVNLLVSFFWLCAQSLICILL